jgi:hypothetical protein
VFGVGSAVRAGWPGFTAEGDAATGIFACVPLQ